MTALDQTGNEIVLPVETPIENGPALSKFIHRNTLFSTLRDNLRLPIQTLHTLDQHPSAEAIAAATGAIIGYLEHDNPYYFTYRYGYTEGKAMENGIRQMHTIALWAHASALNLECAAIRRYRQSAAGEDIIEEKPAEAKKW